MVQIATDLAVFLKWQHYKDTFENHYLLKLRTIVDQLFTRVFKFSVDGIGAGFYNLHKVNYMRYLVDIKENLIPICHLKVLKQ